jgi:hypothetical protein
MAQIILIAPGDQQRGELPKLSTLGYRPAQWCHDNLKLYPEPIPLGKRIELTSSQHVFVRADREEESSLQPGLYPSGRTPTEVRELLSEL